MAKKKNQIGQINSEAHLIELIEKQHGAGAVMKGRGKIVDVDVFSTGVASIDIALGCGGLPQGRIMEIYGPESGGKTTTCLQFIAACQHHTFDRKERDGVCAFIDAEHALDPVWAEKIGVDMDQLLLSQPNSGDEALSIVEFMVKSKLIDLIVVDSVAALVPQSELDGELADASVGAQGRMMSKAMRMLKGEINKSKTTVIFINQIREKIGVTFGNPETTPGGRALKFYASVRGEVRRISSIKDSDEVVGFRTVMKVVKNKVAPPFMRAEFDICVGKPARPVCGIDTIGSLLDVGLDQKIIQRSGSHYSYGDIRLGNGVARTIDYLRDNDDMTNDLRKQIYDNAFGTLEKHNVESPDDLDNEILDDR